jgi:hypothetical protein
MEVLPNDLVRECLLRVTYKSHDNLRSVCRSWESMVSNPEFYADRKISGTTEQLLCLIQLIFMDSSYVFEMRVYDPVKGTWERLPPIDHYIFGSLSQICVKLLSYLVHFHVCSSKICVKFWVNSIRSNGGSSERSRSRVLVKSDLQIAR